MVQSGISYTFTTSDGRTYSGVTIPANGGWLTLRFDGSFALSGGADNLLHVLVQAEAGGGIPNITVTATGGGSTEVRTSDSSGMCVFTVTTTPPQPFPWGVFVAFGIVAVAVAVMYGRR